MSYSVFGGTLNLAQSINHSHDTEVRHLSVELKVFWTYHL